MPQSRSYFCTILTPAEQPAATIQFEAETDVDAVLKGSTLGRGHANYAGYEIRDGDRIIYMRAFGLDSEL